MEINFRDRDWFASPLEGRKATPEEGEEMARSGRVPAAPSMRAADMNGARLEQGDIYGFTSRETGLGFAGEVG